MSVYFFRSEQERASCGALREYLKYRLARLSPHCPFTGYPQYICLPESELTPVPAGVDSAEAVSLVLNYVTAYRMIHRLAHASAPVGPYRSASGGLFAP